jgi:hypothetical protein
MPRCRCSGGSCNCVPLEDGVGPLLGRTNDLKTYAGDLYVRPIITVSDTEPTDPELYDLWVDIS